ncbi:MAG: hypothetical protein FJ098_12170, partial [Deltaproteobacteria bacterium]|nr:hypothetical protein [Deltaproteobacteria bacterium]
MHALTSTSMIRWMPLAAFLAFLPVFPEGCAGDGDGGGPLADVSADLQGPPELPSPESLEPPAPEELWPPGPPTPALPAWVASRPPLLELSPWAHALERKGAQEPPLRRFGDLAVGNGTVFSMVGFPAPFHRLHNMIGPGYQRKMWFFSDLWLELVEPDGDVTWWAREWMGRVRGTPVVLTHAEGDRATLTAVDAAPLSGATDDPLRRGILRVVILRNTGSETLEGASLRVRFGKPQEPDGGAVQEAVEDKVRRVAVVSGGPVTADAAGLTLALPALPPGGEHVVVIGCATGRDAGEASAAGEALAAADP